MRHWLGWRGAAPIAMAMALGLPCVALVRPASAEPGQAAPAPAGFRVGANAVFGASSTPGVNTDPLRGLDIPAFAVDPANPSHIVLVDENFLTAQCEYHVTFDGGRTWSGGRLTTPADFAQPPCNTFDSGGYAHDDQSVVFGSGNNVYTTFASHRGLQERPETHVIQGEGDSVMVAHSSDGGRTFQTATVAIQGGPGPQPYVIRPGIAVAPGTGGDKLLVAGWRVYVTSGGASSGGGERSLVTATSSDGGATWSGPVLANAPGELVREPTQPVIGPDGTYYVGWRDRNAAPAVNHIVVASSTDGGATWAQSAAGEAAAAGVTSGGGFPRLAVDPRNGALYVVYQSATAAGTSIVLQRSTDRAATWSAPVTVNDDPAGTGVPHDAPAVFVAPDGRVDVLWLDLRNSYPTPAAAKASGVADIYWADSTDGGSTFPANRRITDRSIDMNAGLIGRIGSYTWYGAAEAPTGNNSLLLAWGDPRLGSLDNATQDLFLATVTLDPHGSPPVKTVPTAGAADLSVALSKMAYPGGSEPIGGSAGSSVVVVNQSDTASALAGAVLARAGFGPLLLSPAGGLTKALKDEVARLKPTGAFVVGGTAELSANVVSQLGRAGVTGAVVRLAGATPADTAATVAAAVDPPGPQIRFSKGSPVPPGAVIVNPTAPDASAGVALAASLRYPVLFAGPGSLPAATAGALSSLGVTSTLVVGGPSEVGGAAFGQLPNPKRLAGANPSATSAAVAAESVARGLPANVVYVTDQTTAIDGAVLGAAVARAGGVMLTTAGADPAAAMATLARLHLAGRVDRVVVARSAPASSVPWVPIGIFAGLGLVGLVLLGLVFARRRSGRLVATGA